MPLPLPIRSWADLHHDCKHSPYVAFRSQHYQTCFCLLMTLSPLNFRKFLFPDIFHPTQWSLASPRRQGSKPFTLNSNSLDLGPTEKTDMFLALHELSSP